MPGLDDQDQSETFDEDNTDASETGGVTGEQATFEDMPEVLDVTAIPEDSADPEVEDVGDGLSGTPGVGGVEFEADPLAGADGVSMTEIDLGADASGAGEVELVYSGLMENVRGAQASAAHWEAKALSDDDIEDLGYSPDKEEQ